MHSLCHVGRLQDAIELFQEMVAHGQIRNHFTRVTIQKWISCQGFDIA